MIALGIETSCDDTSVAIVDSDRRILSNIVSSQIDLHQEFGGVVPEVAARSHAQMIDVIIKKALSEAKLSFNDIDIISSTAGPGLIGGVIVGLMAGKTIASVHNKPFVAVNHLEAHALTSRLTENNDFPYLLLLLSGGHCQIILIKSLNNYQKIGHTIDDALGEAFDKIARMLGLGYPGGPIVEEMAKNGDENRFKLPKPLIHDKKHKFNFSFSGLKTAVRNLIENLKLEQGVEILEQRDIYDICASFQKNILEILFNRVRNVINHLKLEGDKMDNIVISGGVAANRYIKNNLSNLISEEFGLILNSPPVKLCTDNGAMVAWIAIEKYNRGISHDLSFKPKARWDFTQ